MKVLFIVPYTTGGGSNRLWVEQYLPLLRDHGIDCVVRPFVYSSRFYDILYRRGRTARKGMYFLISTLSRLLDLLRARRFDLIFIHREVFPFGLPVLERLLAASGIPIIFDLDDAIWQPNCSQANRAFQSLKCPWKVGRIMRLSRLVIAGNGYLREYAVQHNPRVTVIPTPVDTDRLHPVPRVNQVSVTLGWIGSHSSAAYLGSLDSDVPRMASRSDLRLRTGYWRRTKPMERPSHL